MLFRATEFIGTRYAQQPREANARDAFVSTYVGPGSVFCSHHCDLHRLLCLSAPPVSTSVKWGLEGAWRCPPACHVVLVIMSSVVASRARLCAPWRAGWRLVVFVPCGLSRGALADWAPRHQPTLVRCVHSLQEPVHCPRAASPVFCRWSWEDGSGHLQS